MKILSLTILPDLTTIDQAVDLALLELGLSVDTYIDQMCRCDWGDVSTEIQLANDDAVFFGDGMVTGRFPILATPGRSGIRHIEIEHDVEDGTTQVVLVNGSLRTEGGAL